MPDLEQEHGGIIHHDTKLPYAFTEAMIPQITVITRKVYCGTRVVVNSKHIPPRY